MMASLLLRQGDLKGAADLYLKYLEKCPYDGVAADLQRFILVHKIKAEQSAK